MSKVEQFLTAEEEQEIIIAIRDAEQHTSGEIWVHIERESERDAFERAMEVFHYLKMDNTKQQNGVLIYVAVNDRKFVICGDKGIDKVVPSNFWQTTKDTIQSHFIKGAYKEGIIAGISKASTELNSHFPWHSDDTNELSNEISKG